MCDYCSHKYEGGASAWKIDTNKDGSQAIFEKVTRCICGICGEKRLVMSGDTDKIF